MTDPITGKSQCSCGKPSTTYCWNDNVGGGGTSYTGECQDCSDQTSERLFHGFVSFVVGCLVGWCGHQWWVGM